VRVWRGAERASGVANLPKAILIDLDDTVLDDSGSVERCWTTVCQNAAQAVAGLDAVLLSAATRHATNVYWSDPERYRVGRQDLRTSTTHVVHAALVSLRYDRPDLAHAYRDLREAAIAPVPQAIETLAELVRRDFRLGLITNGAGPPQRGKIERFGLAPYVAAIHIEGEAGGGKPDERAYHLALEALGVRPNEAGMVGDNFEWEVVVPQRLGLSTVWVDRRAAGVPAESTVVPNYVITSLDQILPLLGLSAL
jgi:putative hydrolase of the HAD superfamily